MKFRKLLTTGLILLCWLFAGAQSKGIKPNIILIISDDQGISDAGFSGSRDILTPNIDKLAREGVCFSQAYVTHSYCSPSRAGLLSGRYQQRFGHEHNPPYEPEDDSIGLPLDETIMSVFLQKAGYRTAAIGKWHLGDTQKYLPNQRGFDFWYGFSGGSRSYWQIENSVQDKNQRTLMRNENPETLKKGEYITDKFTEESIEFIKKTKDEPFFLYLCYNAPHSPFHAPAKYLERTRYIERGERSVYAAMISAMDDGVGKIDSLLSNLGIKDNTIIAFISDNGGVTAPLADNSPYRGYKGMLFEGGIRVPLCISWKNEIPSNTVYNSPVISLDLLPTFLFAAGIKHKGKPLDGKNLLPYISGEIKTPPHKALYWRTANGASYAIRQGDYKLTKRMFQDDVMLFDLKNDKGEIHDISNQKPDEVKELQKKYAEWEKQMIAPIWNIDGHVPATKRRLDEYNEVRKRASRGETN